VIAGNVPSTLYLGEQMYPVPYSQYQSDPVPAGANSLWIKGITNWTQYVAVPQGATVAILAVSPTGGSGTLNYMDSTGKTYSHDYFFYPNSLLTFYAATIGRHMLWFVANGQSSNQVIIDVVGTYAQPSTYPEYYSGYYPAYYPEYDYLCDLYPCRCYPDYCQPSKPPCENHKGGKDHDKNHPDGIPSENHKSGHFGEDKDTKGPGHNHPERNPGMNTEGRDFGENNGGINPGESNLGENPGMDLEGNVGGNNGGPGENSLGENPGMNGEGPGFGGSIGGDSGGDSPRENGFGEIPAGTATSGETIDQDSQG
jgi:hypothetical protein